MKRASAVPALILPLLTALPEAGTVRADAAPGPPNVVVILADDLGFGDLGINGNPLIATPNLDRIARSGANFTQFYASANICTPSRAGLLTGRYPIRTGLAWDVVTARDERGLPPAEVTVAEVLRDAGYATAMIGKWHLGNRMPYWPTRQGFDFFYGVQHSNDMPDFALYRGEAMIERPVEQTTLTRRYTEEAVRFIEKTQRDVPFFLYLAHTFPHIPLYVGEDRAGLSEAGLYGDVVEELDWSVGAIAEALERSGRLDNTLLVFTSDNGAWWEGRGNARGAKGGTWDGGYRVPMILAWPAAVPAGRTIDEPAMNIDLLPTIAAAAGLSLPDDLEIDGASLLGLFGERAPEPLHESLYFFLNEQIVAIRSGRWKLVTQAYYRGTLGSMENFDLLDGFEAGYDLLFDMHSDAGEHYSYAREHPEIVRRLRASLDAARRHFGELATHAPVPVFPQREP